MFYQTLYFVVCYSVVIAVYVAGAALLTNHVAKQERLLTRKQTRWIAAGTIALFTLPLWPYAVVAVQTAVLRRTLEPGVAAYLREVYVDPSYKNLRVLSVKPSGATVYVEIPCSTWHPAEDNSEQLGILLDWSFPHARVEEYDVAWSECGSADGNTFPPYYSPKEF